MRYFVRSPNFPVSCFCCRPHRQHSSLDISTLDSTGQHLIHSAYAFSSQRNLNSHIKSYLSFCDAVSFVPFPVTVTLIIRYVAYLVSLGRAYGTILNHLSKLLGHGLNWDSDYCYKLLLHGAESFRYSS